MCSHSKEKARIHTFPFPREIEKYNICKWMTKKVEGGLPKITNFSASITGVIKKNTTRFSSYRAKASHTGSRKSVMPLYSHMIE